MKQYTCIKRDNKYFVVEYRKSFLPVSEEEAGEAANEERREIPLSPLIEYSTLPEDAFGYWSTMEGKVFGEEVFEIAQNSPNGIIAIAIPKQQEQDLWSNVYSIACACTNFEDFKKAMYPYSFSKKQP